MIYIICIKSFIDYLGEVNWNYGYVWILRELCVVLIS